MTVREIQSLCVPADKDAHLYLWTTQGFLRDAFSVCDSWGFRYVCTLTWCKQRGGFVGGAFFSNTEFVLFARRGRLPTQKRINSQWFEWPRGKHSAKPEAFRDLVEEVSPGPYLELFARPWTPLFESRPGWHVWGNEVTSSISLSGLTTAST